MTEGNDDQVMNVGFKGCSYSAIATAIFFWVGGGGFGHNRRIY